MASINGNKILEDLKQARLSTPKHSGTISTPGGKVLAQAAGNKPLLDKTISKEPLSVKQSFLKQIEQYNDYIVQNDLEDDLINVDHDYDFSAFTSPQDWAVESERLSDRLSDRKIEIAQTTNDGEFEGMELENGVPSYEAVQNMNDQEFKAYEKKYLLPSKGETLREPASKQIKPNSTVAADTVADGSKLEEPFKLAKPNAFKHSGDIKSKSSSKVAVPSDVGSRVTDEPFDAYSANGIRDFFVDGLGSLFRGREKGRDRRYVPKDLYIEKKMRDLRNAKDTQKVRQNKNKSIHTYDGPSTLDRVRSLAADQVFPVAKTIASAIGSASRLKDQYQKEGAVPVLEDIGNGTMSGLAAPFSKSSSKFWKDRLNTPTGEASSVGKNLADEALYGAAGGVAGKGIGMAYKRMHHGAEDARDKIIRLADEQAKKTSKIDTDAVSLERLKRYEAMTGTKPIDPYSLPLTKVDKVKQILRGKASHEPYDFTPAWVKGVDKISSGIKATYGTNGMIKANDDELASMFEKVGDLNRARQVQQSAWDQLPMNGVKIGGLLGVGMNDDGSGSDEDDHTGSSIVKTTTKHPAPLINPVKKKTGGVGAGVGSMKNNGRVQTASGI